MNFDRRGRLWVVQYLQYQFPAGLKITRYDNHLRAQFDQMPKPPPNHFPGADKITDGQPATASEQLVDLTVLVSDHKQPAVTGTVIALVNWSDKYPVKDLVVTLNCDVPAWTKAEMASGKPVTSAKAGSTVKFTVAALEDADAIILR